MSNSFITITGESYGEARRRREIAAANRMETIARREAGELVEVSGLHRQGEAIGRTFRASLDKLAHDLPPQLAGRDTAEIGSILKRHFRETMINLHESHPHEYFKA